MGVITSGQSARPAWLAAQALTHESFAPYGDVIELTRDGRRVPINNGSCVRHHDLVRPVALAPGALSLSLFEAVATEMPTALQLLERHRLGSQAFVPFGAALSALVVVADAGSSPAQLAPQKLRAFVTNGRQGFQFHPGVWHHPLISIQDGTWLVADRVAEDLDCDELRIQDWKISCSDVDVTHGLFIPS